MNFALALAAALFGYLLGSVSFTRIFATRVAPGEDLRSTRLELDAEGGEFELRSVSATSLAFRVGPRVGCLVSALDMLKALLPTAALRLAFPDLDYYLIASAAVIAGHNYPVFYRFEGGRGMSSLYGSLLVIDWVSIPVTTLGGILLGILILRDAFVAWAGWVLLLLPWFWFRFGDPAHIIYAFVVTVLVYSAGYPEIRTHFANRRAGTVRPLSLRSFFTDARNVFVRGGDSSAD